MKDNEYSRTKIRGFVMGLEAAIHMVDSGDDVQTFKEDVQERIKECCEAWNIKPPKITEEDES